MVFTYHGHHNKSFSSSTVMKQTRCSWLKNSSGLGEEMRCSTSASKTGVLSFQGRPSLVCVLRVEYRYLGQLSDVEQNSGHHTSSCSDYSSACVSKKTGSKNICILGQLQCAVKWTYSLVFCLALCLSPLLMHMRIACYRPLLLLLRIF